VFQIFGLDILIDKNLQPWILEINSNPSLNVFTEDSQMPRPTISEIDLYLKSLVTHDALRICVLDDKDQDPRKTSYKRLNIESVGVIFNQMREIFEKLMGRSKNIDTHTINIHQFCRIHVTTITYGLQVSDLENVYNKHAKNKPKMAQDLLDYLGFCEALMSVMDKIHQHSNSPHGKNSPKNSNRDDPKWATYTFKEFIGVLLKATVKII
jgi:hypothetical protein